MADAAASKEALASLSLPAPAPAAPLSPSLQATVGDGRHETGAEEGTLIQDTPAITMPALQVEIADAPWPGDVPAEPSTQEQEQGEAATAVAPQPHLQPADAEQPVPGQAATASAAASTTHLDPPPAVPTSVVPTRTKAGNPQKTAGAAEVSVAMTEQPGGGFTAAVSISFAGTRSTPYGIDASSTGWASEVQPHIQVTQSAGLPAAEDSIGEASGAGKGKQPALAPPALTSATTPVPAPVPAQIPALAAAGSSSSPSHSAPGPSSTAQPVPHPLAWATAPARPPRQLPIRFKDAVGRNFLWPWERAQSWRDAKRLIESAFMHVEVLGPHVMQGHYDLVVQDIWRDNKSAALGPILQDSFGRPETEAHPGQVTAISPVVVVDVPPTSTATGSTAAPADEATSPVNSPAPSSSSSFTMSPTPVAAALSVMGPPPPPPPFGGPGGPGNDTTATSTIILPELWEDTVQPGMMITMHMWPMSNPPPPPPGGHHHPGGPPFGARGRGRGRGGVGQAPPPPPAWAAGPMPPPGPGPPFRPPITVVAWKPPRGKTRKRQDGL